MTTTLAAPRKSVPPARRNRLAVLASVRLAVTLLILIAATVLVGAWCPQESQVGFEKVAEMFGERNALLLSQLGITDIFHSPWFLILIAVFSVNLFVASIQRVFPKALLLKQPMVSLSAVEISRLPLSKEMSLPVPPAIALAGLGAKLRRSGYKVSRDGNSITAEWGKFGRLAPTVTHIGLLTLLVGVTVTSWTGFSGFQPVAPGASMSFKSSEHSKLWIGRLPEWRVRVDGTRREDYPTGEPKQWYSDLTVTDTRGRAVKTQQISVNNPLSYDGVDIYQSSWGLDHIVLRFNNHIRPLELRQMGKVHAAFLPLDKGTILIFSVRDQAKPLRLFAKTPDWEAPRLLTEIPLGGNVNLGAVKLGYQELVPVTGLQYKCDPGYPITLVALCFIAAGVLLAAVPHRQVWAYAAIAGKETPASYGAFEGNACILSVGGHSLKAKRAFEKSLHKIISTVETDLVANAGDKD